MSRILIINPEASNCPIEDIDWQDGTTVELADNWATALKMLSSEKFDGVYIKSPPDSNDTVISIFQNTSILDQIPDGVALLDGDNRMLQVNERLTDWFPDDIKLGLPFFDALGQPKIIGPEFSPLGSCRTKGKSISTLMQKGDRYYQINVAPFICARHGLNAGILVVTFRDTTEQTEQQKKMRALREAGLALADLRPEEIFEMDVDNRIDLLKDNIIHYTKDLLNFDVVEIRLLDQQTSRLEPLLSVGINSEVSKKPLFASAQGNGVTGFVVATGKSYMCEDTAHDPLYLDGLIGAKSSLTVPLVFHDQVIGSFNVESPEIGAFTDSDLQFVEAFASEIAIALNTLELLSAQQTNAAQQSVEAIHSAVALPIDEILNDTVNVIESYIGHDKAVIKRLRSILKNARDIRQVIQKVGQKLAPVEALPAGIQVDLRPLLKDKRFLVIDVDEQVRESAHSLLERYGSIVETAHEGEEAIAMVRNCGPEFAYHAIIADIRLPDMSGYDLMVKLKELLGDPPLILMTGFGYDPGHSIVKARQEGLRPGAVLYKPFRLDQLLEISESIISEFENASVDSAT